MKIISMVEEKFDHAAWTIKPSQRVNLALASRTRYSSDLTMASSELAGMDRLAVRRWLKAHGRRMPLVVLTQRGKPAVVSDVSEAGASGVIENQASLGKLEKQIEYVCELWTGWRSRAR